MAAKFEYITELYRSTQAEMADPAKWKGFLTSACRNYRLSFVDQLLVYAQRPDATAVLEIERWNRHFGRWVNRGATGIAVFDQQYTGRSRLKYYFDISDTHEGRRSKPVPLWEMNPAWEPEVVEALEGSFGALEQKETLTAALLSAAKNAVEKRIGEYLEQLLYYKEGSYLEILDGESLEALYPPLVEASVGYMLLTRCGIDPAEYFSDEVFGYVGGFNTHDTLNALGVATGDISKLCLEEIARTVLNLHKQEINRTVAERPEKEYSDTTINKERSDQHERDHLQPGGGLPPAQPSATPGAGDAPWEIRIDAAELPEGTPQNHVHESVDQRQAEPAPDGDSADRRDPGGADREGTGTASGRDGGDEGRRSDEVGGSDEQLPADGGRDHPGRTDLQLNTENAEGTELSAFSHVYAKMPRSLEDQMSFVDLPDPEDSQQTFFSQPTLPQQIIDEALCVGANNRDSRKIICAWFMKDKGVEANAAFLRRHYGTNGAGFYFDGQKVSLWYDPDGMRIAYGTSAQKRYAANLTWEQAAVRIRELLDLGRYMPQGELEGVVEYERRQIAERLVSLRREISQEAQDGGYLPLVSQAYDGHSGFPEIYREVEEILADPEKLGMVADELELFAAVYQHNRDLLRFHYPRPAELLERVQDLRREPVIFRAAGDYDPQRQFFISQDEIDELLRSGTVDDRLAVYAYFRTHPDKTDREKFLSHYHGEYSGYNSGNDNVTYTYKCLSFSHGSCVAPYAKVELKWNKAAARVGELISGNRFLSEEDRAAMPEYEHKQLSKQICAFFSDAPDVFQRPYEALGFGEYWKEVEATGKQLTDRTRVEEIYETMMLPLWNATAPEDRNYAVRKAGLEAMQGYLNGTFSVFGTGITLNPPAVQTEKEPPQPMQVIDAPEQKPASMIHHFYVVEDLQAQGPLAITEYPDLESAWQAYGMLPREKVKALGIQNNEKLPGSLDFIQCKDGVDTIIEDYKVVDGWGNEEIQSVTDRIQALLAEVPEQEEPIAAPKSRKERVVFAPIHPEIPRSQRHDFQITNPELGHGSKAEKYQANVDAIRLLKRIEAENRLASPEEQEVLSRYVGWGGLADCFDDRNANYQELKSLLTEEEYTAARESSLTAFYTAPTVIGAMYRALDQMGFRNGNILEPACGVGNFMGMIPASMAGSRFYGVELDSISARIAQQLYQNSNIAVNGFEKVEIPDSFFDVAIGNVPFGDFKLADKRYDKYHWLIHDYFFGATRS